MTLHAVPTQLKHVFWVFNTVHPYYWDEQFNWLQIPDLAQLTGCRIGKIIM